MLFPLSVGSSQVCPTCTCHSSRDSRLPVSVLESRILKRSFPHYTLLVLPSSLSSPSHLNSSPLLSSHSHSHSQLISSHPISRLVQLLVCCSSLLITLGYLISFPVPSLLASGSPSPRFRSPHQITSSLRLLSSNRTSFHAPLLHSPSTPPSNHPLQHLIVLASIPGIVRFDASSFFTTSVAGRLVLSASQILTCFPPRSGSDRLLFASLALGSGSQTSSLSLLRLHKHFTSPLLAFTQPRFQHCLHLCSSTS